MPGFGVLDSNDMQATHCMSLVCSKNHTLTKNHNLHSMYVADMDHVKFFNVFNCQLEERKLKCQCCKKCFDCRRFRQLCYELNGVGENSRRKQGIYCTAVRFYQRNLQYPKTDCMTLDFLNSRNVDEKFINFVEEKEKVLFKVADKFRKVKMW